MATITQTANLVTVNTVDTLGLSAAKAEIKTDFYAGRAASNIAVGLGALLDNKQAEMTSILAGGNLDATKLSTINALQNDIANLSNAQKAIQNSQREMAKIISG